MEQTHYEGGRERAGAGEREEGGDEEQREREREREDRGERAVTLLQKGLAK